MFRLFVTASFLFVSVNAVAGENAFNADMQNPTISAAISEFEEVCFPFIAHETELTAEQDRAVFQSRMVEAGYEMDGEKEWEQHKSLGLNYGRTYTEIYNSPPVTSKADGRFTVFSSPERIADRAETGKITGATGEIGGPVFLPRRITHYTEQRYQSKERSTSAYLVWKNVPDYTEQVRYALKFRSELYLGDYKIRTSFPPASSCTVLMHDESLTADMVESKIINRDSDWRQRDIKNDPDAHFWTQCTNEGQENYIYEVSQTDATLFLSVKTLHEDEYAAAYGCDGPKG